MIYPAGVSNGIWGLHHAVGQLVAKLSLAERVVEIGNCACGTASNAGLGLMWFRKRWRVRVSVMQISLGRRGPI